MEKSSPHCKLSVVKALIEAGQVKATASAFNGAREAGNQRFGRDVRSCLVTHIRRLLQKYDGLIADHRIWQDVYRAKLSDSADVYLKLTVIDDVLIVSFKEL